jgi:Flp pilus assembly protein CpaB
MAIVVGLVAAFVVKQAMKPKPVPVVEKPKEKTIPVVVAARNLPEHAVVRAADVRVIQVPVKARKEGTLPLTQRAIGRIVKEPVKAGLAVLEDNLYGIGETLPGLESRIPVGMRAMPIHVDEQSVVAKMVSIGSHVDVAWTVEGSHPDIGGSATKTLLHNVEVIAVEKPSTKARTTNVNQQATITVAVSPEHANLLINAEGTGKLDLTLCSPEENGETKVSVGGEDNRVTREQMLGLTPIPPAPPAPKPVIIEHWEGGAVKTQTVTAAQQIEAERSTAASKKFNPEVPVTAPATN